MNCPCGADLAADCAFAAGYLEFAASGCLALPSPDKGFEVAVGQDDGMTVYRPRQQPRAFPRLGPGLSPGEAAEAKCLANEWKYGNFRGSEPNPYCPDV